ncbi:MAG: electron transfer flavoprotein subunit beta/FixA family protein [Deltaproteobacteria bacterium]|nr:electron transfer flavoprotein subunit beta/FixA family protein [Deltaproteobacteria bacterium]
MSLNIVVCIKQVPNPEHFDRITLDPATGAIRREGVPSITNPLDRHAMEEALLIRERFGGTVSVITMGPPPARKSLEDALAMGADRGAILCDQNFAGADSLATAHILAAGVRALGPFDLVLCGNESVDGATGQVTPQLAEFLDIPHVTCARKLAIEDKKTALVERAVEGGYLRVEVSLPAAISVLKGINRYRLPTAMGIMAAADREIIEMGCSVCESAGGILASPTKVTEVFESSLKRKVTMLTGGPEEVARDLLHRLREMEALS